MLPNRKQVLKVRLLIGSEVFTTELIVVSSGEFTAMAKQHMGDVPRAFCLVDKKAEDLKIILQEGVSNTVAKAAHEASHIADVVMQIREVPEEERGELKAVYVEYLTKACFSWGVIADGRLIKIPETKTVSYNLEC
jgi:hypothetical protein